MPPEAMTMGEVEEPTLAGPSLLSSGRYVVFGPFRIDQQKQEVTRNGSRLKLQGKVYQTLITLLEKPGEVVTREELRMRLWPADTHVNYDANVNTTVNKLRMALGDSSGKPLYVETIPRKGYCLLVQPEVSNRPIPPQIGARDSSKEEVDGISVDQGILRFSKSDLWVVLSAIGLILAGMLLGAGIMRLWITHAASVPAHSLALFLARLLARAVL
jgi:DNA-binding winged helix-turn-helix (wHTH) protein